MTHTRSSWGSDLSGGRWTHRQGRSGPQGPAGRYGGAVEPDPFCDRRAGAGRVAQAWEFVAGPRRGRARRSPRLFLRLGSLFLWLSLTDVMTRLLIVDDDPMVREELGDLLRDEGHQVASVAGGAEALQLLQKEAFDVLLTDLRMPRMSGIELLREVRDRYPELYPVMLTGFSTAETAVEALKAGAFDYVPKPFRLQQVMTVLAHLDQERAFRQQWSKLSTDPEQVVQSFSREGKEVLVFVWGKGEYVGAHVVSVVEATGAQAGETAAGWTRIQEIVRSHVERVRAPVVLLERVDRLLPGPREDAVLADLERLGTLCREKDGRLLVTVAPNSLPSESLDRLRRALRLCFTTEMTSSLASPVRRSLVVRLSRGPASLGELRATEGVEDESKAFFHLHKLMGGGLVQQAAADRYSLTEMGSRAAAFLSSQSREPGLEAPAPGLLVAAP